KITDLFGCGWALRASTNEAQTLPLTTNDCQISGARPRFSSAVVLWTDQRPPPPVRMARFRFARGSGPQRERQGDKSPSGECAASEALVEHADHQPVDR